jgi:2-polyprenyl-3-methyl-5-hydroxy-6-metoxy-1,4-benzoquinol methylase
MSTTTATTTQVVQEPEGWFRLDPVPTVEEVDRYYAEEFYARAETAATVDPAADKANLYVNDSSLDNLAEEAEFHRRSYDDLLALLTEALGAEPHGRTIADVGCGYGHWLAYAAEHGITGYGVEPVAEGPEHCRTVFGIDAFCIGVEDLVTPPQGRRVDIVTMLNVLEHLREPAKVLTDLRANWLHEGGTVLIRVPNDFNALQVAANAEHDLGEWWVAAPRHINYFSHSTLAALLERCGFEVTAVSSTFPLEMFLLMGDVYVGDPVLGKACHRKRVKFERTLDRQRGAEARRAAKAR